MRKVYDGTTEKLAEYLARKNARSIVGLPGLKPDIPLRRGGGQASRGAGA
jgi:hypothetical protein